MGYVGGRTWRPPAQPRPWRAPATDEEAPKRGGTLTYMIPADAPPSFDGHREGTYATVHAVAPFYSVLIRINPENPSSTTDFVCDLCTEMPKPTDDGKTYTFKIRDGVKFHDGSPLTAADVAASWKEIIFPPKGVLSPRQSWYDDGRQGRGARPDDRRLSSQVRDRRLSAGARRPVHLDLREGDPRQGSALVREERDGHRARSSSSSTRPANRSRACATPITITRGCPISTASSRIYRRQAGDPGRRDPRRPCRDRVPRHAALGARRAGQGRSATRSRCRRATGTAAAW